MRRRAMLTTVLAGLALSGCELLGSTDTTTPPVAGTWAVSESLQRKLDSRSQERRVRKLALERALRRETVLTTRIRAKAAAAANLDAVDVSCQWRYTSVFVSLTLRNGSRSPVEAFVIPGYVTNDGVQHGSGAAERVALQPGEHKILDIDAGRPDHVDTSMSISKCNPQLRDVWLVPVKT